MKTLLKEIEDFINLGSSTFNSLSVITRKSILHERVKQRLRDDKDFILDSESLWIFENISSYEHCFIVVTDLDNKNLTHEDTNVEFVYPATEIHTICYIFKDSLFLIFDNSISWLSDELQYKIIEGDTSNILNEKEIIKAFL